MSKLLVHAARRLLRPPAGTRLIPPAGTLVLCFLTIGVFVGQTIAGDRQWIRAAGAIYTSVSVIFPVTRIGDGQAIPVWLTLFTYMFLHGSWWHLLSNVAVVWIVGTVTEPVWGTSRFVLTYLACGVTGALATGVVLPHSLDPAFGASLAYCGVYGAYLALLLPHTIRCGGQALVLVVEAAVIFLVVAWFGVRAVRADWDGSLMYHFLPFTVAWFSVRVWNGFGYVRSRLTYFKKERLKRIEYSRDEALRPIRGIGQKGSLRQYCFMRDDSLTVRVVVSLLAVKEQTTVARAHVVSHTITSWSSPRHFLSWI